MTEDHLNREIVALLSEMRDRQKEMAETTRRLETLLQTQAENTTARVEQSIALQKVAVERQRHAMYIAVPLILLCLALIAFLILRFL